MKKILFKKLLSDCLVFFFISLFSTSIIIWVFQAVNFLDIIVEDGRDYLVYINFSLLNSQYTETINSNRPGLSQGAFSVGKDVLQFELGYRNSNLKNESFNNSKISNVKYLYNKKNT